MFSTPSVRPRERTKPFQWGRLWMLILFKKKKNGHGFPTLCIYGWKIAFLQKLTYLPHPAVYHKLCPCQPLCKTLLYSSLYLCIINNLSFSTALPSKSPVHEYKLFCVSMCFYFFISSYLHQCLESNQIQFFGFFFFKNCQWLNKVQRRIFKLFHNSKKNLIKLLVIITPEFSLLVAVLSILFDIYNLFLF